MSLRSLRFAGSMVIVAALGLVAPSARADDVQLVGGSQIEGGRATRQGDKVVVELEAGRITLSADSVQRIDSKESALEHADSLDRKLKPRDVAGLLALANYCREHDMPSRERDALERILEVSPDHAQARSRLGYARKDGQWISRDAQLEAKGFVHEGGQWLSKEQAAEAQRLRTARETEARSQRELEIKRSELEQKQLELENERERAKQSAAPYTGYYYAYRPGYGARDACGPNGCTPPSAASTRPPAARDSSWPINGVRDPRDTSWPINGVRDPNSRDASWPINGVRDPRNNSWPINGVRNPRSR